jgi:hypothetical protein
MAKKQFFLTCDTETTQDGLVADFAAVITDRKGKVYTQCAVMVDGVFTDQEKHPLFHLYGDENDIWSKAGLPARYERYMNMVAGGSRMIASVAAINVWIVKAMAEYNPILTAYNLAFDLDKCNNTGINFGDFSNQQFCLWHAAVAKWGYSKKYLNFMLETSSFNAVTKHKNFSYKTNAEVMTRFVTNQPYLEDEPHTALEDVLYYELPILNALVKNTKKEVYMNPPSFNWRKVQVKDYFTAK